MPFTWEPTCWSPMSISFPSGEFLLGLAVWSPFSLTETQKLTGQALFALEQSAQQGAHSLFFFLLPTDKEKKILSGLFFLNEWGEYIWFHWVFPRLCCFCTSPVLTPNFSPPATISPALRRIFVCIFGCVPLLPCGMRVFLMYPLMSRYQCMLIITKADVSRYSYSRVNIHKPIDGSGFPHMPTWSGSLQQGG